MIRKIKWNNNEVEIHEGNILFRSVEPVNETDIQRILGEIKLISFQVILEKRNTYQIKIETSSAIPTELVALKLNEEKSIVWAEPDFVIHLQGTIPVPNDPKFPEQWNLATSGVQIAWQYGLETGSDTVRIAVLDSGIPVANDGRLSHPDLKGSKFVLETNFVSPGATLNDTIDHGTGVTGIIGATTNNEIGIAGVNWNSEIHIYKVTNDAGPVIAAILQSVEDALAKTLHQQKNLIINLSISTPAGSNTLLEMCQDIDTFNIENVGVSQVILCASAGNKGTNPVAFPAGYSTTYPNSVVCVGASTAKNEKTYFSNWGDALTVLAPGEGVITTRIDNTYGKRDGASFSVPLVAGILSLLWSCNSHWKTSEVIMKLKKYAVKLDGGEDFNPHWGYGIVTALWDDSYYITKFSIDLGPAPASFTPELAINLIN